MVVGNVVLMLRFLYLLHNPSYHHEKFSIFFFSQISFLVLYLKYQKKGISTLSSCGNPEALPELPPGDEHRLQRAALNLQQKLILREWLKENRLQSYYSRYFISIKYLHSVLQCF